MQVGTRGGGKDREISDQEGLDASQSISCHKARKQEEKKEKKEWVVLSLFGWFLGYGGNGSEGCVCGWLRCECSMLGRGTHRDHAHLIRTECQTCGGLQLPPELPGRRH